MVDLDGTTGDGIDGICGEHLISVGITGNLIGI
jgi:hypothetical protein